MFHHVVAGLLVITIQPVVVDETRHGEQVLADSMWVGVLSQVFLGKVLPLIFISQDINSLISVSVTEGFLLIHCAHIVLVSFFTCAFK